MELLLQKFKERVGDHYNGSVKCNSFAGKLAEALYQVGSKGR